MSEPSPQPSPRWWPLIVVAAAALLALAVIWLPESLHRQSQVMKTLGLLLLALLSSLVWLLLLSRLRWRLRLMYFAGVVLAIGVVFGTLRIKGMSGDFVPILERRWASRDRDVNAESGGPLTHTAARPYPQFLGPQRNARLTGFHLERDWEKYPPRPMWRRPVGEGWSSFAVAAGRALTQEQHGDEERVVCYDLGSGRLLWSHADSARYSTAVAGTGPRATPTIDGDRVFTVGATGLLNCLDLESGRRLWSRNIIAENGGRANMWGVSCSPLVRDSLVVVSAGGPERRSLVAYHRASGDRVWSGGGDPSGYSSPTLLTLAGREQILIFNRGSVVAHAPADGKVLWRQTWPQVECIAQPVPLPGDRILVSSGYGIGAKLYQVAIAPDGSLESSIIWESPRLKAKFTNVVYWDGFIYGLDDGVLVCLDPTDGQRRWKRGRYGHGQVILVEDLLLVLTESGEIVLVEARPDRHSELARLEVLEGKTWNPPALAAPYLLVRHDRQAVCYELTLAAGSGGTR